MYIFLIATKRKNPQQTEIMDIYIYYPPFGGVLVLIAPNILGHISHIPEDAFSAKNDDKWICCTHSNDGTFMVMAPRDHIVSLPFAIASLFQPGGPQYQSCLALESDIFN